MLNQARAMYQVMRDAKLTRAELDGLVHKRLKAVLVSAYQNVPYYRDLMDGARYRPARDFRGPQDLAVLPITTKADLKGRETAACVLRGSDLSRACTDITSGSSGIPFRVYRTKSERAIQIARWLRVLFVNGYSARDRVMSLTAPGRVDEGRSIVQRFGILRRLAVDYLDHSPEEMVDVLLEYEPDVLYGNRSHLDLLALELRRRGIQYEALKLLLGTGEVIYDSSRQLYRQQFGAELLEVYGTVEMGVMAYETSSHDGLHLCEDLTYFEFLDGQGQPVGAGQVGRVVVTDLTGKLMPFIRYDQGDLAVFEHRPGGGDHPVRVLTQVVGRDSDYAILPDGTKRTAYDFSILVKKFEGILQFRVIQRSPGFFQVLVVADPAYVTQIHAGLLNTLQQAFPPSVQFEIVCQERLEPDPAGKLRLLVSEMG